MNKPSRDIVEFAALIEPRLAWVREMLVHHTLHRGGDFRARAIVLTLALCYRDREMFQPPEETWFRWMDDHLAEAVRRLDDNPSQYLSREEDAVWHYLLREPPVRGALWTTTPGRYDRAVAAEEGSAEPTFARYWFGGWSPQNCKPCWKCRWFDGWLPPREPVVVQYLDPEITQACANIDRKRIEIAQRVREGK